MLIEFRFTADGWIEFIKDEKASDVALTSITDDFNGRTLSNNWQWSVFQPVHFRQKRGRLELYAKPSTPGAYVGIKTMSGDYTATTEIKIKGLSATAGIGIIGDDKNMISA